MPGLKCSVEFSEHYSDVEREFCHDEMSQECATEYSEECSTEIKEEYFESSGHECTTEIFEQCKDVQWKVCHDQPTEQCSTEYSVKLFFPNQTEFGLDSAACKINFFSKPKWNWFGKSYAIFLCNIS